MCVCVCVCVCVCLFSLDDGGRQFLEFLVCFVLLLIFIYLFIFALRRPYIPSLAYTHRETYHIPSVMHCRLKVKV